MIEKLKFFLKVGWNFAVLAGFTLLLQPTESASGDPHVVRAVAPLVAAALIGGALQLTSGMLNAKAQKEERKRQRLFEAEQQGFQNQMSSQQALSKNQQTAFQDLMAGYGRALL